MLAFFERLPVLEKIVHFWRIFRRDTRGRLWIYILISFVVSLVESLGISLFFPVMSGLQNAGGAKTPLEQKVMLAFGTVGLPYNLTTLLAVVVVVFLVKAVIQFAAAAYQSRIVSDYLATISKRLYAAITEQEYRHFLTRNIGVLSNAMVTETYRASVALVKYATLFPSIISISVFSVLALRVDWKLTFGVLAFGGSVLALMRSIARLARRLSYQSTEYSGRLNELVLQSFGAFKYLLATAGLGALRRRVESSVDELARTQYLLSVTANLSQIMTEPVAVILLVGMVWQQTVLAHNPLAQVVVLAVLFYRLIKEVMIFQGAWHGFAATMGSIDFVSRVIAESEGARETFTGVPYRGFAAGIRVAGVSYAYGARTVLHDLSLEIPKNALVAVVGESGSGKSTFVDLLTGVLKPATGELYFDEQPYSRVDLSTFRRRVGYVTQEPALFNDTIAENISFWGGAGASRADVEAAAKAAGCLEFIRQQEKGFETVLGDRGVNLSGGQRQRVAIARELFKRPDLLILDEATSALDSEAEREVQRSIEGLRGKLTTVVIAHRLSTIRQADRIYVVADGRVVESGDFASLYAREGSHFRRICQLQGLNA
jgi:ABC-type multidrug transport system fused ATPase/permease subunit